MPTILYFFFFQHVGTARAWPGITLQTGVFATSVIVPGTAVLP